MPLSHTMVKTRIVLPHVAHQRERENLKSKAKTTGRTMLEGKSSELLIRTTKKPFNCAGKRGGKGKEGECNREIEKNENFRLRSTHSIVRGGEIRQEKSNRRKGTKKIKFGREIAAKNQCSLKN